jgi:hypothetical protein
VLEGIKGSGLAAPNVRLDGSPIVTFFVVPNVTDYSTCSYVVQSGAEVANSLFTLSAEDGAMVSASIIGVWVAAWVIRQVINVVKGSTDS